MGNFIDNISIQNEKMCVTLAGSGAQTKILTTADIPNVAELYKTVFAELQQAKCDKFLHPLGNDEFEELISDKGSAIVGYFKDKQLVGAMYTKPFDQNSPYFQTPSYDKDKISYAIGGIAVHPQHRGNGIISKLTNVTVNGVEGFATQNPQQNISGLGFEISCENFGSLMSLGCSKDANMQPIFNYSGLHYLQNPINTDNDLTVLGYKSFETPTQVVETLPQVILNGSQSQAFASLTSATHEIASENGGLTKTSIDGHTIETFSNNLHIPFASMISYDPSYTASYPPVLEK